MQDHFLGEVLDNDLVPIVCDLIQHAKHNGWAIILLQYEHPSSTKIHHDIIESVKDYPHTDTITKYGGDGGAEVLSCIKDHPSWPLDMVVCGIYGDECVSETVAGLFDLSDLAEIEIVVDAVYPGYVSMSEKDEQDKERECLVTMEDLGVPILDEVISE
jgi:nicotinamidase-related amidase